MNIKIQKNLKLFALFGIAYWFFGNLYEVIVFGPKWIISERNQLMHLNAFFPNASPTYYFNPMTLIAAVTVFTLFFVNKVDVAKLITKLQLFYP